MCIQHTQALELYLKKFSSLSLFFFLHRLSFVPYLLLPERFVFLLTAKHLSQVLQFCFWKASELLAKEREVHHEGSAKPNILKRTNNLEVLAPCNYEVAMEIFGGISNDDTTLPFSWDDLVFGITRWEEYVSELRKKLLNLFPLWLSDQILAHASNVT